MRETPSSRVPVACVAAALAVLRAVSRGTLLGALVLLLAGGCGSSSSPSPSKATGSQPATAPSPAPAPLTIHLSSPAFADGKRIPTAYTCDGIDDSPPLRWSGLPAGTVQLALFVEDPGAKDGPFVHWVLFAIPPTTSAIARGAVPRGAIEGTTGFSQSHYGGPCPPVGDPAHRYVFTLYALRAPVSLPKGAPPADVHAAVDRVTIAAGRLTGTYLRG